MNVNPINRTLAYKHDDQQWRVIAQGDIAAIAKPVVILGDPGMGKSVLTQTLGDQPGMSYCPAGTFHRANRPEALIAQGERIIVDGLDEIASSTPGGAVDSVLRQLSRMDGPRRAGHGGGTTTPASVIHHSDQGCQYTSLAFGERCRQWGVAPSMGSGGLLRQRHGGELLRHSGVRAARPHPVP